MKQLCLIMLFMYSLCAYSMENTIIQVSPTSKQFSITVPGNPTTGYQWTVKEYNKKLLQLTASRYIRSNVQLIGSGGTMVFDFKLRAVSHSYPKTTRVLLQYARPWDLKTATLRQVTVQFKNHNKSS